MAIDLLQAPASTVTPATVEILSRRATFKGIQYVTSDAYSTEVVTVNNGHIGCTCGMDRYFITCSHILKVETQEATYAEEAKKRDCYCSDYAIY